MRTAARRGVAFPYFLTVFVFLILNLVPLRFAPPAEAQTAEVPQDSDCCYFVLVGAVYYDVNGNGVQETGEPGLAGWTVEVVDATYLTVITSTTTDSTGAYTFIAPSGCGYPILLREVLEPGWTQTFPTGAGTHALAPGGCSAEPQGPYDFGNTAPPCGGFAKTYTLDADFNLGTLAGLVTNSDQLELVPTGSTFEYAWIANAGEGTISKVSTVTGKEVGRYYTGPPDGFGNYAYLAPSRTVVDTDGNCWVANRNFSGQSSVTQILAEGGVDLNANSNIETSVDGNSNGEIETTEILPWGQDERVVRHYLVGNASTDNVARGLALDKTGYLWVALYVGQRVIQLDPTLPIATYASNQIPSAPPEMASISTVPANPYGLALSGCGLLYAATLGPFAIEIDPGLAYGGTGAGPAMTQYINHGGSNYGIAADKDGIVWLAKMWGDSTGDGCVRWDPTVGVGNPSLGFTHSTPGAPGPGRGITVDFDGNIWMACNDTLHSVAKYDNAGNWLANYPSGVSVPIGIGAGPDENMIVVGAASASWSKVNKSTGAVMPLAGPQLTGFGPYTYTDFTGSLRNITALQQGTWSVITDGGTNGIAWVLVDWNDLVPPSTGVVVEARVASSLPVLATLPWTVINIPGTLTSPIPGRFIETRVRLTREQECGQPFVTPVLYDLTVEAECDTCYFVGCPGDTTISCETGEGAHFTYPPPAMVGDCDSAWVVTCDPPSGSLFPIGSTVVVCTATSPTNEPVECTFVITVTDDCVVPATGACCIAGGCVETTEAACELAGGIYGGDGTTCAQEPCEFTCVKPPPGLVAWWPFDVVSLSSTPNLAAPGLAGALQGAPTQVNGQYVHKSLSFDGSADHVIAPNGSNLALGSRDFSIDAWIRTTKDLGLSPMVDKRQDNPIQGYSFFLSNGYPGVQLAVGGVWTNFILNAANGGPAAFVADGKWHLVAVTVDRNHPQGVRFYVDGAQVGAPFDPTPHQGNLGNTVDLWIAKSHPIAASSQYFDGEIDEVEIFNRALTAAEVGSVYDGGTFGKCREACYAQLLRPCCKNTAARAGITICNYSEFSHTYSWGLSPSGGPGCAGLGASSFNPPSGTITVPAGGCVTIPVDIACPTGVPAGAASCYLVSIFNHDTGDYFGCSGSVRRPKWWCWNWAKPVGVDVVGLAKIARGRAEQLTLQLAHIGLEPAPVSVDYKLVAVTGDQSDTSRALSLNGRPPGEPVVGRADLDPAGEVTVPLLVEYVEEQVIGYDRIQLYVDDDMDGTLDLIGDVGVQLDAPGITAVGGGPGGDGGGDAPRRLFLALPNPFNASARISFELPERGQVSLRAFDLSGRMIKTFYRKQDLPAGVHGVVWDGRDDRGKRLSAGVYFLRLETPVGTESVKAVLLR